MKAGAKVSLEPGGSWLPVAQNNLHAEEAHCGVAWPGLLESAGQAGSTGASPQVGLLSGRAHP